MGLILNNRLTKILILVFSFFLILFSNNVIFLFLSLILIFVLSKLNFKRFGLWLFIFSFIIKLIFVIFADWPQLYDFDTLLTASYMFSDGDFSFNQWGHFSTWGYQTGFVIYQGLLLKLFNSVFFLKVLNILYSSLLVLFVYKISARISNEKSARIVSLLYLSYPFYIFFNRILANHHFSSLLMYFGIFFIIKKNKTFKDYVFAGLLIGFGNFIRPEGIIVVLSFIVYELFMFNKKNIIRLIAFLFIYFSIGFFSSFLVIKTNVNPIGLTNKEPLWKFIVGLNHEFCGKYNHYDLQYLVDDDTKFSVIRDRIFDDPISTLKLMKCKVGEFWFPYSVDYSGNKDYYNSINIFGWNVKVSILSDIISDYNYYLPIFIIFMFFLGFLFNKKNLSNEYLFFLIMILFTFLIYLFIEIQPRYAYFIHISLFILSSLGIKTLFFNCNK